MNETTWRWPDRVDLPGYRPTTKGNMRQVVEAAKLIMASERPVLYVGGGVIKANATEELFDLATTAHLPVVTTLMARGAFPDSHELALGMPGMHGVYTAVTAMQKADLLVAIGARFDDRVTGQLATFAPDAKIVHVDIDPAEIGKNRVADVPIVGDCKDVTAKLLAEVTRRQDEAGIPDRSAWFSQLAEWQEKHPLRYDQQPDGPLKAQYAIERLRAHAGDDAIVVAGVGQHQMWASQFWSFEKPRTWINSGGLGTMGFAVPAALGAAAGQPDRRVIAIDGDGCFQMTCQELATSTTEKIPFVTAIINNAYLGMVRQWQELFYEALLAGAPHLRRPRLREARGGLRRRRPAGRAARGGRRGDREGPRGRRPERRDRLPVRRTRDVLPDGAGGRLERRHHHGTGGAAAPGRSGGGADRMSLHTISVLVEDKPGVLTRVAGLFSARGSTSTRSRSARPSPRPVPDDDRDQRRVQALGAGHEAAEQADQRDQDPGARPGSAVERELMLLKVRARGDARARIMEIAEVFRVSIVDVTKTTLTVEASGKPEKLEALRELLGEYGIVELSRTGRIALSRGERGIQQKGLRVAKAAGAEDQPGWTGGGV